MPLSPGNASIPALLRNSLLCSQIHITTQLGHRIAWALLGSHGMVAWAMHPKGMPPTWGLAAAQTTRDRMARPVRWTGTLAGRSEAQVAVMLAILLIGSVLAACRLGSSKSEPHPLELGGFWGRWRLQTLIFTCQPSCVHYAMAKCAQTVQCTFSDNDDHGFLGSSTR